MPKKKVTLIVDAEDFPCVRPGDGCVWAQAPATVESVENIPEPTVRRFEVTITTPALDYEPPTWRDVDMVMRRWLNPQRQVAVREVTK